MIKIMLRAHTTYLTLSPHTGHSSSTHSFVSIIICLLILFGVIKLCVCKILTVIVVFVIICVVLRGN